MSPTGAAGLPLVRLTLAVRDLAEFQATYAARLEREGLFVTTARARAAGERVRLRVELMSGATAWIGEAVVTGAARDGGRSGFWVRRALPAEPAPAEPAPAQPALRPVLTPPRGTPSRPDLSAIFDAPEDGDDGPLDADDAIIGELTGATPLPADDAEFIEGGLASMEIEDEVLEDGAV